jgi:hypothetical protein
MRALGPTMNEKALWDPSQCAATQLERQEVIHHLLFPNQPTLILFLSLHAKDPSFLLCPFLGPTTWQNRPGICHFSEMARAACSTFRISPFLMYRSGKGIHLLIIISGQGENLKLNWACKEKWRNEEIKSIVTQEKLTIVLERK